MRSACAGFPVGKQVTSDSSSLTTVHDLQSRRNAVIAAQAGIRTGTGFADSGALPPGSPGRNDAKNCQPVMKHSLSVIATATGKRRECVALGKPARARRGGGVTQGAVSGERRDEAITGRQIPRGRSRHGPLPAASLSRHAQPPVSRAQSRQWPDDSSLNSWPRSAASGPAFRPRPGPRRAGRWRPARG